MKTRIAAAAGALLATGLALTAPASAGPGWNDPTPPPPGCGFTSQVPWSPCAEIPPWGHKYPGGYDWTGKEPGMWGPGGYTPKIG